jgi:hypothetical protein
MLVISYLAEQLKKKLVALVRQQTILTERPPLVRNFCGWRGVVWSERRISYGRNHGFLHRSRYLFDKVSSLMYS